MLVPYRTLVQLQAKKSHRGVYARTASPVLSSARLDPSAPYANAAAAAQDLPRSTVHNLRLERLLCRAATGRTSSSIDRWMTADHI